MSHPGPANAGQPSRGRAERDLQDDFWCYQYKVLPCPNTEPHDWERCIFAHRGDKARRRHPSLYAGLHCPEVKAKLPCPRGDECPFAHSPFELWLHPSWFLTAMCELGSACNRAVCFFCHSDDELRPVQLGHTATGPSPPRSPGPSGAVVGQPRQQATSRGMFDAGFATLDAVVMPASQPGAVWASSGDQRTAFSIASSLALPVLAGSVSLAPPAAAAWMGPQLLAVQPGLCVASAHVPAPSAEQQAAATLQQQLLRELQARQPASSAGAGGMTALLAPDSSSGTGGSQALAASWVVAAAGVRQMAADLAQLLPTRDLTVLQRALECELLRRQVAELQAIMPTQQAQVLMAVPGGAEPAAVAGGAWLL